MEDQGPRLGGWVEDQVRNTPWWMISIAFHLIVLAGMTVVTFKETLVEAAGPPTIIPTVCGLPKIPDIRPPDDIVSTTKGFKYEDIAKRFEERNDEPSTDRPDAVESWKNESADNDDHEQMKGKDIEIFDGLEDGDGKSRRGRAVGGPGDADVMGTGPGLGGDAGRWGTEFGGRVNRKKLGTGGRGTQTATTENAVVFGLRWLARHQAADGRWSAAGFDGCCAKGKCGGAGYSEYDAGVTGLALLAFLGAGYTPATKETYVDPYTGRVVDWGMTIRKGLKWLIENQDVEGCFGGRSGSKYMYNHAIAALAMAEGYGLTLSPLFQQPAQAGIDFLLASQNPYKAWRYTKLSGDNDTSVTGWAVMALKSAQMSDLKVGRGGFEGARAWITECTEESYYKTGYTAKGTGKVVVQGKNDAWDHHEALTAVGMLCRVFIDADAKDPALAGGARLLTADLPRYATNATDYYYWYYGSLALFQYDGPKGAHWTAWNEAMKTALVPTQKTSKDGCAHGSWDSDVDRWGFEGGRVYATAINVLTLEVYYRYESVFGGGKRGK